MASLEIKLAVLARQFSEQQLVAAYSKEIVSQGDAFLDAGGKMDSFTQGFYDNAKALEESKEGGIEYGQMIRGLDADVRKLGRAPQETADAFMRLKNEHVDGATIMKLLGGQIEDLYQQLQAAPQKFTPAIAATIQLAHAEMQTTQATNEMQDAIRGAQDALDKQKRSPAEVAAAYAKLNDGKNSPAEIFAAIGSSVDSANQQLLTMPGTIDSVTAAQIRAAVASKEQVDANNKFILGVNDARLSLDQLRSTPEDVAAKIDLLSRAGYTDGEIMSIMGDEVTKATDAVRYLKEPLSENSALILKHAQAAQKSEEEARKWHDAWTNSMDNVKTDFSKSVDDMLFEGKSFSSGMKSLFKDLAENIVKTLVEGAFTKVAKGISGLIFGSSGGSTGGNSNGSGGVLENLGGGVGVVGSIASLFGLGSGKKNSGGAAGLPASADFGLAGVAANAGNVAGAVTTAGKAASKAATGLSSLATSVSIVGGVIGAVSGAVDIYNKTFGRIGAGRKAADVIVPQENAFVADEQKILAANLSASDKLAQLNSLWTDYQANLAQLSASSPDIAKVAGNSFSNALGRITEDRTNLAPYVAQEKAAMPAAAAGTSGVVGGGNITVAAGAIQINLNIDAGDAASDPAGWAAIFIKLLTQQGIPEITRQLGLNQNGLNATWIRIMDRGRKGVYA